MPLAPGARLGPYEILAPVGAGGMGEVYKACDTRLDRIVAIKISKDQFSARFEQEARAVAALNHPHICQLFDVGPNYLVMEFVEGAPLQGPLPLDKAVEYAGQILDALDAAHQKGITHRDLKPANIMVTKEGIKLLDFGLAKQAVRLDEQDATKALTRALTEQGQILGTLQYMSPEQLQGKEADARSDLFSFGCVLYESLTGKRAFDGKSAASVIAAILEREPAPLEVAWPLDRIVRRSLAKDPDQRFQTARDLKAALAWAMEQPPAVAANQRGSKAPWAALAAVALVAAGVAGWGWWRATRPLDRPLVRLDVDLGPEVALPALTGSPSTLALSPDGTRLVYLSGNPARLYTRRLDQSKANQLPGTEGAVEPFFSPDGQWLLFFARSKLNKISVEGGAVVPLTDLANYGGASWGADGTIIIGQAFTKGLVRIPASGGSPTTVLDLAPGELGYLLPQILPGGKAVLFVDYRTTTPDTASIEVFSFADRRRKTLVQGGTMPRYLPSGHLIYSTKGTLFAIPFDVDRLETRGTAVPVLDDVAFEPQLGAIDLDFAETGTLVYRRGSAGGATGMLTIQWVDGAGKREPLRAKPGAYSQLWLSPDGKRMSFTIAEGANKDVWVYDPQRETMTRLTFGGIYLSPIWSPDGRYIVFGALGKGMYWTRADGAGQPQPLTQSKNFQQPTSFARDGKRLAYMEATTSAQIFTLPLEEQDGQLKAGKPEQFLKSQFNDSNPAFSPDGHWLGYTSNDSGKNEVYVRPFPPPASGQGGKWQISNSGGTGPFWSRNGRELVYHTGDRMMAVSYSVKGDSFVPEKQRVWIEKLGGTDIDLAPDGKRMAVLTPVETADAPKAEHEVTFLFNFFDELRRRVPTGK